MYMYVVCLSDCVRFSTRFALTAALLAPVYVIALVMVLASTAITDA